MPPGKSGSLTSLTYLSLLDANPSKPPGNCPTDIGRRRVLVIGRHSIVRFVVDVRGALQAKVGHLFAVVRCDPLPAMWTSTTDRLR